MNSNQQGQSFSDKLKTGFEKVKDTISHAVPGHHDASGARDDRPLAEKAKDLLTGNRDAGMASSTDATFMRADPSALSTGSSYNVDYAGPQPGHRLHSDQDPLPKL
jgi:hypothetical protein